MIFIAEFCQNHNGDFEILKDMIWAAKENGADYAKIQNIYADMLTLRPVFEEGIMEREKTKVIKRPYQSEYDRLKKLELNIEEQAEFIKECNKAGIEPLTTVFTRDSVKLLRSLGFKDIKIASYDCGSLPLLDDIKGTFNKIFVSTGASYGSEIEAAAKILNKTDFSFLHCVTIYPTPLDKFNLARMQYLQSFTQEVGWSDHSLVERDGILGTASALFYGAEVIERHFTILPPDETKDGPVSITPVLLKELKELSVLSTDDLHKYLVENFPDFEITYGKSERNLSDIELLNRDYYRGRFASKNSAGEYIYNWEEGKVVER